MTGIWKKNIQKRLRSHHRSGCYDHRAPAIRSSTPLVIKSSSHAETTRGEAWTKQLKSFKFSTFQYFHPSLLELFPSETRCLLGNQKE